MGNYSGTLKTTGQYTVRNIYDLAGNVYEWTMEKYGSDYRVMRGGFYDISGSDYPASIRDYNYPFISNIYNCARVALYM